MIKGILLFIFAAIVGFLLITFGYPMLIKNSRSVITPLAVSQFSLENAPTQSLVGNIATLSGAVSWQSRTAENPVQISALQLVKQGEELETGQDGNAIILFDHVVSLTVLPNTKLAIIQTLPANIVFSQQTGSASYESRTSSIPVSIRALDLLLTIKTGKCTITIQKDAQEVSVFITSGTSIAAFTDVNNTTVVQTLIAGQTLVFSNKTKHMSLTP